MEYWRGTKYRKDRLPNLPYFRVYLVGCMCAEPGPPDTRFSVPWDAKGHLELGSSDTQKSLVSPIQSLAVAMRACTLGVCVHR